MLLHLGRGTSPLSRRSLITLKDVVPSCVFDLDATIPASYPGSDQLWRNLVPAPADGETQGAYHFVSGANASPSTDDPTFTGTQGSKSAYFLLDGGDNWSLASGANTTFLNALHKTTGGTSFWVALVFRCATFSPSGFGMSTAIGGSTNPGAGFFFVSDGRAQFQQRGDTATISSTYSGYAPLPVDTDLMLIYSYNGSILRRWLNSTSNTSESLTFNATASAPSGVLCLGSKASGSNRMPNGTRFYAFSMGNAFIDNAEAAKIAALYNTRHGRTYA